jgi:hypothetical protein
MQKFLEKIIKLSEPIVKWWGRLHIPFTHKQITGRFLYKYSPLFKPGDIFLTKTRGEFSNIINPSVLKHGGIFFGTGLKTAILHEIDLLEHGDTDRVNLLKMIQDYDIEDHVPYVIEAIGRGVVPTDLATFMLSKDVFVVTRWVHDNLTPKEAAFESLNYLLWPYDYGFKIGNKKMYCFELCATSYINTNQAKIDPMIKEVDMVGVIKAYDYRTFYDDRVSWSVLLDSRTTNL